MTKFPPAPEPLAVPTTDAHTHLGTVERKTGLTAAEQLERARAVGVVRVVDVGYDVASSQLAVATAEQFDNVIAVVAIHPHDAAELGADLDEHLRALEGVITSSPRVRGIGETGLDYHWIKEPALRTLQAEAFATHIGWAKKYDKTLVIHDRDAHDDVADVLDAEGWPERVQMHCFSGDVDFARRCLDAGAYLSFPGNITFKANQYLRDALAIAPADRILVETDAPYLTPMPHRGRPNASYLVPHTVRFMAEVRGDGVDELCAQLHTNATNLFGNWGSDD